ncbi:hypothetical protein QBC45DRAFT_454154 [Copromyces sp. CBS 386.78]|nr:hypothetical protein QBC45DRAFT_454154 [Copromyces sp. CBS 386.78]
MSSLARRYKSGPAPRCPAPQIPGSDPLNPTSSDGHRPSSDTEFLTTSSEHARLACKHHTDVHAILASHTTRKPSFIDLPAEIHLLITEQLIYPDALSMKHVNRYFYNLVDTGVRKKVEWLCQCRKIHLGCPNDKRCDLGSDVRFCRGSVRLLMQRWREHNECEARPGLGCLVYSTSTCVHRRKLRTRVKRWMRLKLTIDIPLLILALLVVLGAWWAIPLFY